MLQAAQGSFRRLVREFFLLEAEERKARALSPVQRERVQRLTEAAAARSSVADDLTDPRQLVASVVLYREVIELLLSAVIATHDVGAGENGADVAALCEGFRRLAA